MKYSKKNKIIIVATGILAGLAFLFPVLKNIAYAQVREPILQGRCFPDSPNVSVGESVSWVADVSGGSDGRYSYSWSGTNKLLGSSWTTRKSYDTPGIKTASVRIRTRVQTIVRTCSVNIGGEVLGDSITIPSELSASCFATPTAVKIGENVTWTVIASGGTGKFRYDWAGAEGLTGNINSIVKNYMTTGTKSASVNVSSGQKNTTTSCSLEVFPLGTLPNSLGDSTTGNIPLDSLPETGIRLNIWRTLFFLITASGLTILVALVFVLRKKSRELKKRTDMAYETESRETDVARIIEKEARHKKFLVAADALKILIEKSEHDPAQAIKNLNQIIAEMKKRPLITIPGEESWPVIKKEETEKYFLRRKAE